MKAVLNFIPDRVLGFAKSPLTRISFGLVMLTASLLLVSELLGLVPDVRKAELDYRKHIAETVAVQASLEIGESDDIRLQAILQSTLDRNDRVKSIALKQTDGLVVTSVGDHVNSWTLSQSAKSTMEQVRVALYSPDGLWGNIEIAFHSVAQSQKVLHGGGSLIWVVLYVAAAGFVGYYFFLKKVLRELDPNQVLPDRVRTALDTLTEGLMILDHAGTIMFCNTALSEKLGMQPEKLIGRKGDSLNWYLGERKMAAPAQARKKSDGADRGIEIKATSAALPWMKVLTGEQAEPDAFLKLKITKGREYKFTVNTSPIEGDNKAIRGVLVTLSDITEVEKKRFELQKTLAALEITQSEITLKNEELYRLATRDSLTDVLNRRAFFESFDSLFLDASQSNGKLGCIMVDIDKFKSVNDNFGHGVGDTVIRYLASVMVNHSTDVDVVGRFGGEEFCMLLPGATPEETQQRSEQMRLTIERSEGASFSDLLTITASFGVSTLPAEVDTPHQLLDYADQALYYAKEHGRNQVSLWGPTEIVSVVPSAEDAAVPFISKPASGEQFAGAQKTALGEFPTLQTPNEKVLPDGRIDRRSLSEDAMVSVLDGERNLTSTTENQGAKVLVENEFSVSQRHMLTYNIEQAIARSKKLDTVVAVFILDATPLKHIADVLGYQASVKLSSVLVDRIKNILRVRDVISIPTLSENNDLSDLQRGQAIAETDNNQLAIVVSDVDEVASISSIVERLLTVYEQNFVIDGNEYMLETSLGVSVYGVDATSAQQLVSNACVASADAKRSNDRNEYRFYSRKVDEAAKRELRLQNDLPNIVDRDELHLVFQPKVSLEQGEVVGFEALLRWDHPKLGAVPPSEFIPLAEQGGTINEINQWVMTVVADQIRFWLDAGVEEVSVAVNVSAVELRDESLADRFIETLTARDLPKGSIEVEITESAGIESLDIARETLQRLSDAGFRIAIDDFGTGYASLNYLQEFPIERVKIDQSFIDGMGTDERKRQLVRSIITLGAGMGMRVLAEGVETEEQLEFLMEYHCDEIQGYLVSRPVDVAAATAILFDPGDIRQVIFAAQLRVKKQSPNTNLPLGGLSTVISEFPDSVSAADETKKIATRQRLAG